MSSGILRKLFELLRPRDEVAEFERYLQALARANARAGSCLGSGVLLEELGMERRRADEGVLGRQPGSGS